MLTFQVSIVNLVGSSMQWNDFFEEGDGKEFYVYFGEQGLE